MTMTIERVAAGAVTITLHPGEALAIAEACDAGEEAAWEANRATHAGTFALLRGTFEALALLGAARGHLVRQAELDAWTPAGVRADWHFLPETPAG